MRRIGALASAVVATAFVLSGCGGGGGGPAYDGAKQVAAAVGCGSYHAEDQTTLFAAETGSCRFHNHYESVDWFKDETSRDNFKKVADQIGGSVVLYGSNFAITCEVRPDCDAFHKAVGGELD
jgi:hypothetical protein